MWLVAVVPSVFSSPKAAIVIFFIKLGRYLDGISKDKTKEAIQKLVQITPNKAIIKVDGQEKEVTIDEIKKGDIVVSQNFSRWRNHNWQSPFR